MGSRGMFVREFAMFDGRSCVLLRLFVLAEIVMMGRLSEPPRVCRRPFRLSSYAAMLRDPPSAA